MRRLFLAIVASLCAAGAAAQTLAERARKDEVVMVHGEDPAMNKAFERARASLDPFLEDALAPRPRNTGHALKVRVREGDNVEYFWVSAMRRAGADFKGVLDNEPRLVKNVKAGQLLTFTRADIVDWLHVDPQGQMRGSYTTCVLLSKEKPEEARALAAQLRLRCD